MLENIKAVTRREWDGQLDEGGGETINITLGMKRVAQVAMATVCLSERETEGVDRQVVCLTQYMWTDRTAER